MSSSGICGRLCGLAAKDLGSDVPRSELGNFDSIKAAADGGGSRLPAFAVLL